MPFSDSFLYQRIIRPVFSTENSNNSNGRQQWGSKIEFLLAATGYCVGQGAFTRFPYVCMKNGGGAFLIPFLVAIVTVSIPVCYLEMLLGQFSGQSALTVWSLSPAFKGLGFTIVMLSIVYAPMYMQYPWATYYFFSSISSNIPWRTCGNSWNTEDCQQIGISNTTGDYASRVSSASEEYWNYHVLSITKNGLDDLGGIKWHLALTNLFCWVTVFFCTMKGAKSTGKVVLVTATLPFFLVVVLLFRGITLEGSYEGIVYFLKPDLSKLASFDVWLEGFIQAIFQTAVGWGGLITMASYNRFQRRAYWDAILLNALNVLFTLLGGIAVFSVFGFMAKQYNVGVGDVAATGPGLAFVAYPEALTQMPFPQFWALAFFLTLMSVAIDSLFGTFEVVVSGLLDTFPRFRKRQILTTAVLAILMYLNSLIYCTQGGMYLYQIIDWYGLTLPFLTTCFFECLIVSYIYGIERFFSDVELMFGCRPSKIPAFSWMILTPIVILVIAFSVFFRLERPTYDFTNYTYPDWSVMFGWLIGIICFLPTPIVMIYSIIATPGGYIEKFLVPFKSSQSWLPNCPELIEDYKKRWYDKTDEIQPWTTGVAENFREDKTSTNKATTDTVDDEML